MTNWDVADVAYFEGEMVTVQQVHGDTATIYYADTWAAKDTVPLDDLVRPEDF